MPRDASRISELARFHTRHRRKIVRIVSAQGNIQVVQLAPGEKVSEAVDRYRASGLVQFAEPDYAVSTASVFPSDPRFQDGTQWGLNNYGQNGGLPDADIDAPEAWDVRHSASNVIVAVVDTGVRLTHEDLAANLWSNPNDGTHGFNALTGQHDPADDNGHGTHVAGNIGAVSNNGKGIAGVAWNVRIMACKFLDSSGTGFYSDAVACIDFARTNGAQIINLSWGGPDFSEAVSNAIASARADGILVVAAAGNNARNTDASPFYPAGIHLDNIVSVGASTRLDGIWPLSNYGTASVDLFAPGAAIFSTSSATDTTYLSRDGTSMASGLVTGALALLREQDSNAPFANLIQRLFDAVDYAPAFSGKCKTGGRLNLRKILDQPLLAVTGNAVPVQLRITGQPGHSYLITASTSLTQWTPLQINLASPSGEWDFVDQASTNIPARFYRAQPAP